MAALIVLHECVLATQKTHKITSLLQDISCGMDIYTQFKICVLGSICHSK